MCEAISRSAEDDEQLSSVLDRMLIFGQNMLGECHEAANRDGRQVQDVAFQLMESNHRKRLADANSSASVSSAASDFRPMTWQEAVIEAVTLHPIAFRKLLPLSMDPV